MRLYVDESGNTGGVDTLRRRAGELNFLQAPLFVNSAVALSEQDHDRMKKKYIAFKKKYQNLMENGEIKGSKLCTKEANDAFDYVVEHLLDGRHFYANVYDKRFYLSTLMLRQLSIGSYYEDELANFYIQASIISKQKDEVFIQYLTFVKNASIENARRFLTWLVKYFAGKERPQEIPVALVMFADLRLQSGNFSDLVETALGKGAYLNRSFINLINLNSLAELIYFIKESENIANSDYVVLHDQIDGISDVISDEFGPFGIDIEFANSADFELLQLADNLASTLSHLLMRTMRHLCDGSAYKTNNEWDNAALSRLVNRIGFNHIKWTVALDDQAVYRCLCELFSSEGMRAASTSLERQLYINLQSCRYCQEELERLNLIEPRALFEQLDVFRR